MKFCSILLVFIFSYLISIGSTGTTAIIPFSASPANWQSIGHSWTVASTTKASQCTWTSWVAGIETGSATALQSYDNEHVRCNMQPGANCWISDVLRTYDYGFTVPTGLTWKGTLVQIHKAGVPGNGGYANTMIYDYNFRLSKAATWGDGSQCTHNAAEPIPNINIWPQRGITDDGGSGQVFYLVDYYYDMATDCPTYVTSDINLANFGLMLAEATIQPSPPLPNPASGWAARSARVSYILMTVQLEAFWEVGTLSPPNAENVNPPADITITGTFPNTGSTILCRYTRQVQAPGRQRTYTATWLNTSAITCPIHSYPLDIYETATVEVSMNGGLDWTSDGILFTWRRFCNQGCTGWGCDYTTSDCFCGQYFYGESCEAGCPVNYTLPDYGDRCTSCIAIHPNCQFCSETQMCGGGCTQGFTPTSGCPTITKLDPSLISYAGGETLTITMNNAPDGSLPLKCYFDTVGETDATVIDSSTITCLTPEYLGNVTTEVPVVFNLKTLQGFVIQNNGSVSFGDFLPKIDKHTKNVQDLSDYYASLYSGITVGAILFSAVVFAAYKYRQKILADKFRSLFECPIFTLDSAFSFQYNYNEQKFMETHSEHFWYLEEIVCSSDYYFLDCLTSSFETHESDDMSKALIYFSETNGEAVNILKHYIDKEFTRCNDGVQLFRGYNPASKMWTGYLKMDHGLKYLHASLAVPLYQVCSELAYGEKLELHQERAEEAGQSVTVNKYRLMAATQKIFEAVLNSTDHCPINVRYLLHYLRKKCEAKFPAFTARSVGGFIFLRLFCPAITSPQAYGLLKFAPDEESQHLLIRIASVLQNLANGVEFGIKDPAMHSLNDFIRTNLGTCHEFFLDIADLDEEDEDVIPPVQTVPEPVKMVSLLLIYKYVYENRSRIDIQIEKIKDSESRAEITEKVKAICEAIGEPPELTFARDDEDWSD